RMFPKSDLSAAATRLLARSYLAEKRYVETIELLEPLVAGKPDDDRRSEADRATDRYLLAFAYQGRKRYAEVLTTIGPVITSEDAQLREDAVRLQAASLVALEKFAEAIEPLTSYLKSAPASEAKAQAQAQLA